MYDIDFAFDVDVLLQVIFDHPSKCGLGEIIHSVIHCGCDCDWLKYGGHSTYVWVGPDLEMKVENRNGKVKERDGTLLSSRIYLMA